MDLSSPDFAWQGESCPPFSLPDLNHGIVSFFEKVIPEFQPFIRLAWFYLFESEILMHMVGKESELPLKGGINLGSWLARVQPDPVHRIRHNFLPLNPSVWGCTKQERVLRQQSSEELVWAPGKRGHYSRDPVCAGQIRVGVQDVPMGWLGFGWGF